MGSHNKNVPSIALTFDDGPNTTTTVDVLDKLEKYAVKATFFLIGDCINEQSAKVVKTAFDVGHEICNHSKTHSYMDEMQEQDIIDEIKYTTDKIKEITGVMPKFFRPPYIRVNKLLFATVNLPFINGHNALDWDDNVSVEDRADMVISKATDGGIILLHDMLGNDKTVNALDIIIPKLKEKYSFVTVSELFENAGIIPEINTELLYTNIYKPWKCQLM